MNNTIPIWRDYYVSDSNAGDFLIVEDKTGGEILYSGTASILPDEEEVTINVSDVIYNYLENNINLFPTTGTTGLNNKYVLPVRVEFTDGDTYNISFRNDYSYQNELPMPLTNSTSYPINGKLHPKQYFITSWFNTTQPEEITLNIAGTNRDIHSEILNVGLNYTMGLEYFNFTPNSKIDVIYAGGTLSYKIMDCTTSDYVLYYKNAYGGWDSFVIEGNVERTDKLTNSSYRRAYSNNKNRGNKQQRNLVNYLTTIQPSYKLYTHYMSDAESLRMHHLLESNEIFMHQLSTNMIYPINITDKNVVYQTYTTNGKQMVQYTINVETSQREYRR